MSAVVAAGMGWGIGATIASAGGGVVTLHYADGDSHNFSCAVGTRGSTQGDESQWPNSVANGCVTEVKLFQHAGEQGTQLCITPVSNTGTLTATWRSFEVESGTCGKGG
jgi:hypothetical protein